MPLWYSQEITFRDHLLFSPTNAEGFSVTSHFPKVLQLTASKHCSWAKTSATNPTACTGLFVSILYRSACPQGDRARPGNSSMRWDGDESHCWLSTQHESGSIRGVFCVDSFNPHTRPAGGVTVSPLYKGSSWSAGRNRLMLNNQSWEPPSQQRASSGVVRDQRAAEGVGLHVDRQDGQHLHKGLWALMPQLTHPQSGTIISACFRELWELLIHLKHLDSFRPVASA